VEKVLRLWERSGQDRDPRISDAEYPGGQRAHEDEVAGSADRRQLYRARRRTPGDHGHENRHDRQGGPRVPRARASRKATWCSSSTTSCGRCEWAIWPISPLREHDWRSKPRRHPLRLHLCREGSPSGGAALPKYVYLRGTRSCTGAERSDAELRDWSPPVQRPSNVALRRRVGYDSPPCLFRDPVNKGSPDRRRKQAAPLHHRDAHKTPRDEVAKELVPTT